MTSLKFSLRYSECKQVQSQPQMKDYCPAIIIMNVARINKAVC